MEALLRVSFDSKERGEHADNKEPVLAVTDLAKLEGWV